ncbi:MAG: hypothetical protein HW416_3536 [Chloroflexi bacterium]|nr:hypothetical protein [Chloroflexota bacterium]
MHQSREQLKSTFDRMASLAKRHTWVPGEPSPVELRLTTMDSPEQVSFEAVESFVDYARQKHQVDLSLVAGGYGCFELGFAADAPSAVPLQRALADDKELQALLNVLGVHITRLKTPREQSSYCAYYDMQVAVATNRSVGAPVMSDENGVVGAFGNEFSDTMHYAIADMSVVDLTRGQSREGMLRRACRIMTFGVFGRRKRPRRAILRRLAEMREADFKATVRTLAKNGALLTVHGYANDFDEPLRSCTLGDYLIRLEQLGRVPVLFSWPSQGSTIAYTPDENQARNSQRPFLDALHIVADATRGKTMDLLAHSHGNMVVVSALGETYCKIAATPLGRLVLVEPDVDQKFLEQRVDDVLSASNRVTLYHSRNDRALWFAEKLFASIRAGRAGASAASVATAGERLEVIDASNVAAGLSRHAPHIDSPEVIRDIHDVLEGTPPLNRFGVRKAAQAGYWEIVPSYS